MGKIFISYRRDDAADAAGRIFDRLVDAFGEGNVFKDVDSIPLGADFEEIIAERLTRCDVVLVIIGVHWLEAKGADGEPRIHHPQDFVRIEIEQALNSSAIVIPALLGNTEMPRPELLPESIRRLTKKQAISIRSDPKFRQDMGQLIRALEGRFREQSQRPAQQLATRPAVALQAADTVSAVAARPLSSLVRGISNWTQFLHQRFPVASVALVWMVGLSLVYVISTLISIRMNSASNDGQSPDEFDKASDKMQASPPNAEASGDWLGADLKQAHETPYETNGWTAGQSPGVRDSRDTGGGSSKFVVGESAKTPPETKSPAESKSP